MITGVDDEAQIDPQPEHNPEPTEPPITENITEQHDANVPRDTTAMRNKTNNTTDQNQAPARISHLKNCIDAVARELSTSDDNEDDNDNDISSSISGYREAKERIAQLEEDMDSQYGTRLRQGLRS